MVTTKKIVWTLLAVIAFHVFIYIGVEESGGDGMRGLLIPVGTILLICVPTLLFEWLEKGVTHIYHKHFRGKKCNNKR